MDLVSLMVLLAVALTGLGHPCRGICRVQQPRRHHRCRYVRPGSRHFLHGINLYPG